MRSAFNKEIARSIKGSIGRFVAIVVISFLGAGFYAGLRMAAPDMRLAADEFFDATAFGDLSVVCTWGLDDQSIDLLSQVEGAAHVMPTYSADVVVDGGGQSLTATVESLPASAAASETSDGVHAFSDDENYLNRPLLAEGEWPQAADQCVVGEDGARKAGLEIGQVLVFEEGTEDLGDTFAHTSFRISGFVESPAYIANDVLGTTSLGSGFLDLYIYVTSDAFAADLPFTKAAIAVTGAAQQVWDGAAYDEAVAPVRERVERAAQEVARQREAAVRGKAQQEIDDAQATLDQERADADAKLDDAAAQLSDAQSQLGDAHARLSDAKEQLDASRAQLEQTKAQLEDGDAQHAAGVKQLEAQRKQLQPSVDALPDLQAQRKALAADKSADPKMLAQLDAQIKAVQEGVAAIDAATEQLNATRAQLDAGWKAYKEGLARYQAGLEEYEEGRADYDRGLLGHEEGQAEYRQNKDEAEREFAQAQIDIDKAQADLDAQESPEVFVLDRTKNPGAASRSHDAQSIDQIATLLPFMFFLVAALVVLTSMTRMVDEERLDIGTHKALGYGKGSITAKYLIYGALACGIGSVLGVVVMGKLLPWFILTSYGISYSIPVTPVPIDPAVAAQAIGLSLAITLASTWGAAAASLRERPAALMLPKAPKAGKRILLERIGPLWRRLSFSQKVTARNLLRYKRRFFMAVVGIAGCTALLMIGFGLRDAIGGIVSNQFDELVVYDVQLQVDDKATDEEKAQVDALLAQESAAEWMAVGDRNMIAQAPDEDLRIEVIVPSDAQRLDQFVTLRDRESGQPLAPTDDALVLTEKAARELGVGVGDEIVLFDENVVGDRQGEGHRFVVGGFAENYLQHYAYVLPQLYRQVTGEEPVFDRIFANVAPDTDHAALSQGLLGLAAVDTVSFTADRIGQYQDMLDVMDKLIVVIVLLSAALAFVVLYNLTNINITERVREIATLKVLGFTRREVRSYIFREIIIMVVIGALVGCVVGVPLTGSIAEAAETATMMFGRTIEPVSFVASFAITVAFAFVVAAAMGPKLARINMVESLKSVE